MCFFFKKKEEAPAAPVFRKQVVVRSVSFAQLPQSLAEFEALLAGKEKDPFAIAGLSLLALCLFQRNPELCYQALGLLRAPLILSEYERSFLIERLAGKDYKPFSYFEGATPANDYQPSYPLITRIKETPESTKEEGYLTLYFLSSGATSPRMVRLRERHDGSWALWEEFLLADIITPRKDNPWA